VVLANRFESWCRECERRFRGWPGHWEQLESATASLVANVGEAFDSETLAQKRRYFGYALASAGEISRLVNGALRAGILPPQVAHTGLRLLKDVRWDLIRLIEWTKR
jgi:four helix bundle protein